MGRIDPLPRTAVPEYDEIFTLTEAFMGVIPNSLLTMAKKPRLFEPFMRWASMVLNPEEIDLGLSELIAYLASVASGCRYCQAHTSSHAAHLGVDAAKVEAAFEFETSPLFTDAERVALRVALHGGMSPNGVTDEMFTEMRAFYTETACIEIVAIIAFFGHMNRWNDTMATTLEAAPIAFATQHLAAQGWNIGRHAPHDNGSSDHAHSS